MVVKMTVCFSPQIHRKTDPVPGRTGKNCVYGGVCPDVSAHASGRTLTLDYGDLGLREPEEALEAYGEAGRQGAEPAGREQDPGHERGPVQGVVPDRQRLAGAAEEDLLVGHQS